MDITCTADVRLLTIFHFEDVPAPALSVGPLRERPARAAQQPPGEHQGARRGEDGAAQTLPGQGLYLLPAAGQGCVIVASGQWEPAELR